MDENLECVKNVKQLFQNVPSLQQNLVYISVNFGFLSDVTLKLEKKVKFLNYQDISYNN